MTGLNWPSLHILNLRLCVQIIISSSSDSSFDTWSLFDTFFCIKQLSTTYFNLGPFTKISFNAILGFIGRISLHYCTGC